MLGQSDLTKLEMHKVVMQTADPVSTRKATEQMVKILNSTYAKVYLKQVTHKASQMNAEKRTL